MEISFDNSRFVIVTKNWWKIPLILKPWAIFKKFNAKIATAAIKTHEKLVQSPNIDFYNKLSSAKNTAQIVNGTDNEYLRLNKVRCIQKVFLHLFLSRTSLHKKDWKGQFRDISKIFVFDINNHDYKKYNG